MKGYEMIINRSNVSRMKDNTESGFGPSYTHGSKLFVFWNADSFDPPQYYILADSFEEAYEHAEVCLCEPWDAETMAIEGEPTDEQCEATGYRMASDGIYRYTEALNGSQWLASEVALTPYTEASNLACRYVMREYKSAVKTALRVEHSNGVESFLLLVPNLVTIYLTVADERVTEAYCALATDMNHRYRMTLSTTHNLLRAVLDAELDYGMTEATDDDPIFEV